MSPTTTWRSAGSSKHSARARSGRIPRCSWWRTTPRTARTTWTPIARQPWCAGRTRRCRRRCGRRSCSRTSARTRMMIDPEATPVAVSVFDRLHDRLQRAGVPFTVLRHEPVYTSEQAAAVRGSALSSGAKALVVKAGERFVLLILPADRKLDSKKARDAFGVKGLRFASKEEVEQLTGLQPGSIPPFGSLFNLPTYCDPALADNPSINFNAGDHSISIQMAYADYARTEQPAARTLT